MDVWAEVDKRTAPPPSASPVRSLSREEIEALQASGQVTPVDQIPEAHFMWPVSFRVWINGNRRLHP